MDRLIRALISAYRKLPFKPFHHILVQLYYSFIKSRKNIEKTKIATINGITYELDLTQLIDSTVYYSGCFENDTTKMINRLCKKGMCVFDIGANMGCHAMRLAKIVGPNGKVYAFEPMDKAFKRMVRNAELNNFQNIVCEKISLSDESKADEEMFFNHSWPAIGSYIKHEEDSPEKVRTCTIDAYVRESKTNKIDFIKIDVDGYEAKIIKGGINSIQSHIPIIIVEFVEYNLIQHGDSAIDLGKLLLSIGYSFFSIDKMELFSSVEEMIETTTNSATPNIVALPLNKSEKFIGF